LLTLSTYIIHRDVVAAIAPGNLAAFPPSLLEVNADIEEQISVHVGNAGAIA
jgi:hypothetical protein